MIDMDMVKRDEGSVEMITGHASRTNFMATFLYTSRVQIEGESSSESEGRQGTRMFTKVGINRSYESSRAGKKTERAGAIP